MTELLDPFEIYDEDPEPDDSIVPADWLGPDTQACSIFDDECESCT